MLRFGPTNGSPADAYIIETDTPVGHVCQYFRCDAPILDGESGYIIPAIDGDGRVVFYRIHRDCYLFSLGIIGIDHKAAVPHEPNSAKCNCNQWTHRQGT